jgi:hypothetical protein
MAAPAQLSAELAGAAADFQDSPSGRRYQRRQVSAAAAEVMGRSVADLGASAGVKKLFASGMGLGHAQSPS